jgi:hypothetical protein
MAAAEPRTREARRRRPLNQLQVGAYPVCKQIEPDLPAPESKLCSQR